MNISNSSINLKKQEIKLILMENEKLLFQSKEILNIDFNYLLKINNLEKIFDLFDKIRIRIYDFEEKNGINFFFEQNYIDFLEKKVDLDKLNERILKINEKLNEKFSLKNIDKKNNLKTIFILQTKLIIINNLLNKEKIHEELIDKEIMNKDILNKEKINKEIINENLQNKNYKKEINKEEKIDGEEIKEEDEEKKMKKEDIKNIKEENEKEKLNINEEKQMKKEDIKKENINEKEKTNENINQLYENIYSFLMLFSKEIKSEILFELLNFYLIEKKEVIEKIAFSKKINKTSQLFYFLKQKNKKLFEKYLIFICNEREKNEKVDYLLSLDDFESIFYYIYKKNKKSENKVMNLQNFENLLNNINMKTKIFYNILKFIKEKNIRISEITQKKLIEIKGKYKDNEKNLKIIIESVFS